MTTDAEERLVAIRNQQQETARKRAQAEARLDEVRSRKQQVLDQLQSEFGCADVEAAQDKLKELREVSDERLKAVEEQLREMQ